MADAKESNVGLYFAIVLLIVGIMALIYLARSAAKGAGTDFQKIRTMAEINRGATGGEVADSKPTGPSSMVSEKQISPAANWATYTDQAWRYKIRFPKTYRARLIDSNELISPLPGEVLLTGIVVAPSPTITEKTPNYAKDSLTLLITDWPSFGTSQNFLNATYTNGTVPKEQIEKITVGSRPGLRLKVNSDLGGVATTHTEMIIAGPGTKILKVLYWPADDQTLKAIASTISIAE